MIATVFVKGFVVGWFAHKVYTHFEDYIDTMARAHAEALHTLRG